MTARTRSLTVASAAAFAVVVALTGLNAGAQAPSPPPLPLPSTTPGPSAGSPVPAPTIVTPTPLPPPSGPQGAGGRRGRGRPSANPSPTATPTSPAFATLDGTWEVQVQYPDHTTYAYLVLRQKDNTLSGAWRVGKVEQKLEGTYDGRLIHLTVKQASGPDISFSGYVENASDMVGIVDFGKNNQPAFTAEHRGQQAPHGLLQKY